MEEIELEDLNEKNVQSQLEEEENGVVNGNTEEREVVKLYFKRWVILFIFSMYSFTNSMNWIIFAPIAFNVMEEYSINSLQVNSLSMVYMLVYIIGCLPASYIVDKKSLRMGIIIGSMLNALGAIIRCFPFPLFTISEMNPYSFYVVFVGQLLAAISQTFFLAMPPKIVQRWFGSNERVSATSIASSCNQLGTAFGLIIPSYIVRGEGDNIIYLLLLCAVLSVISALLILLLFENYPKTSPSLSSAAERKFSKSKRITTVEKEEEEDQVELSQYTASYRETLKALTRDKNYFILFTMTGLLQGSAYAFSTLFGQMLLLIDYTDKQASMLAFALIGMGIIGAIIISAITDRIKITQQISILFCTILCLAATLSFTLLCTYPNKFIQLMICCCILGFFETGVLPLFMDSSVEITYPLPAAITTNIVMASPQMFGIIFILGAGWFLDRDESPTDLVLSANVFLMFWIIVSLLLSVFYYPENKRLNMEKSAHTSNTSLNNIDSDVPSIIIIEDEYNVAMKRVKK